MSELLATLKDLKLYGMASAYAELLAQNDSMALANDHWMLKHLVQVEQEDRAMRSIRYQLNSARFPLHRDLAGFDFDVAKVDRALITQLATLDFTDRAENIVLIGGTGTGKTHLATALGIDAVTRYEKRVRFYSTIELVNALEHEKSIGKSGRLAGHLMHMDLVILDELGYLPFSQAGGALLFHLLSKLYEHTSVIVTTNRLRGAPRKRFNAGSIFTQSLGPRGLRIGRARRLFLRIMMTSFVANRHYRRTSCWQHILFPHSDCRSFERDAVELCWSASRRC